MHGWRYAFIALFVVCMLEVASNAEARFQENKGSTGTLVLRKVPANAEILIDGKTAPYDLNDKNETGFSLAPKIYLVVVKAEGATSKTRAAVLKANEKTVVDVDSLFDPSSKADSSGPVPKGPYARRTHAASKAEALKSGGGNEASEAAVAKGLAWLASQQQKDGSWRFDGDKPTEVAAATGLALLPFFASGITQYKSSSGKPEETAYVKNVAKGVTFLKGLVAPSGKIAQSGNYYGHGIATIALCEAIGMARDRTDLRDKAQAAVNYIVKGQGKDGGWRYTPGSDGDTSVVGWQVQALRAALNAELKVPPETLKNAGRFLDKVAGDSGATYGYVDSKSPSPLRNSVGLYCRQHVDKWTAATPGLAKGAEALTARNPPTKEMDMYYGYYATQVLHGMDGPLWKEKWNPAMRDMLIATQYKTDDKDRSNGSWNPDKNSIGTGCGRLGCTSLSILALQVYYRH